MDAKFKIGLPLLAELPASSVKVEAKGKITDGRVKQFLGAYQVQGATFDLDISEKAAGANGQMLINGVLAKLSWQRIFDAPLDKQPPLRLTATLDNTDRSQLGLDVNHIVQGVVPIEVTVGRGANDEQSRAPARRSDQRRPFPYRRCLAQAARTHGDAPVRHRQRQDAQDRAAEFQGRGRRHRHRGLGGDRRREPPARVLLPRLLAQRHYAHGSAGHPRQERHLEGEGARSHVRRARLLPLAVLARPARRERAEAEEPARGHRSRRRDRHRHRPFARCRCAASR